MMFTVYDVTLQLQENASVADLGRLRDHFRTLSIDVIGLDRTDFKVGSDELTLSIYGSAGPFMMKKMIQECTQNIFPGSVASLRCR